MIKFACIKTQAAAVRVTDDLVRASIVGDQQGICADNFGRASVSHSRRGYAIDYADRANNPQ
jgi:hypothetical protein